MKIVDMDLKENGKKYFCKDTNEVFEVEEGNLIAEKAIEEFKDDLMKLYTWEFDFS